MNAFFHFKWSLNTTKVKNRSVWANNVNFLCLVLQIARSLGDLTKSIIWRTSGLKSNHLKIHLEHISIYKLKRTNHRETTFLTKLNLQIGLQSEKKIPVAQYHGTDKVDFGDESRIVWRLDSTEYA